MSLLSELVPQMRKGMWAQRGSKPLKNSGWSTDTYVLIEDGEFALRSGDPTERSVTCDFIASPADFTFKGWRLVDPKLFIENRVKELEARMIPLLSTLPNQSLTVSWDGGYDRRAWEHLITQGGGSFRLQVEEGKVVIGWEDHKDYRKFSRVMKRGDIEWMDRARALLKDHRFSRTLGV